MPANLASGRCFLLSLAALVAAFNVLPLIMFDEIGGDILLSHALLQCFGEHVWSGHFYPRWCMNANGGYGSPVPIFYFPLPFYIASLLYPLRALGMELGSIFIASLWLVSAVGFITATHWLKSYTTPARAMACAAVFLFLSYRMEALTFRAAYAESWAIALLPLLFLEVRKWHLGGALHWPKLSLLIAAILLCHAPAALIGIMACGIQLLFLRPKALPALMVSVALGYGMTYFHWYAAEFFTSTLHPDYGGVRFWRASWVNAFADFFFAEPEAYINSMFVYLYMRLGWLTLFSMTVMLTCAFWLCRTGRLREAVRKEALVWLFIMLFGVFMMFSPSTPLWKLIVLVSKVETPWRMASLVMFGFTALLAIDSREMWDRLDHARRIVAMSVLAALVLAGACIVSVQKPQDPAAMATKPMVMQAQKIFSFFNLRWMQLNYLFPSDMPFFREFILNRPQHQAGFISGSGEVSVAGWNNDGINIRTESSAGGVVRVEHLYHPLWRAAIGDAPASLKPEENSIGRMLIDVPAGAHEITIVQDAPAALPPAYRWACLVSLASLLASVSGWLLLRRHNK